MARDGPGFLNGDQDADLASEISRLVGFEMYAVEDEKKEERVKDLNNHKLDVVFEYLYKVYKDGKSPFGGDERPLVLFSLMAMQLGATFEKEHLGLLREAARQLPTVYEQLMALTAVDEYKNNGTPWILESPLEIDRGSITDGNSIDWWEKPDGLGHSADEPPYPHVEGKTCMRCGKRDLTKSCDKCKIARYCDEDCQKADLELHQNACSEELRIRQATMM